MTAVARAIDPGTSWAAADSVEKKLLWTQEAVLAAFDTYGAMTDSDLVRLYEKRFVEMKWPMQSPSGLRTRRKELTRAGKIRDSGEKSRLRSGRMGIVWELA